MLELQRSSRRDFVSGSVAALGAVAGAAMVSAPSAAFAAEKEAVPENLIEALQLLLDKEAIRDKICMYQHSMDRCDAELGYSVFWEDAQIDVGDWCTDMSGKDFVDECVYNSHPHILSTSHQFTNTWIKVNGDKAGSESYAIIDMLNWMDEEGGLVSLSLGACRYNDKWEKRDGDWRIVDRVVSTDAYVIIPNLEMTMTRRDTAQDKTDPSYEALAYGEE